MLHPLFERGKILAYSHTWAWLPINACFIVHLYFDLGYRQVAMGLSTAGCPDHKLAADLCLFRLWQTGWHE